jgi:hypothetical protein
MRNLRLTVIVVFAAGLALVAERTSDQVTVNGASVVLKMLYPKNVAAVPGWQRPWWCTTDFDCIYNCPVGYFCVAA